MSSPLRLDLEAAQCVSLELHFSVELPEEVRRELTLLGSREGDQEDMVFFHEDYRSESQKLHSWGEVHLEESGASEVIIEYLVESELEDQTELHHTTFTLSHLFDALEPVVNPVGVSFTIRFDLGANPITRFVRLLPYDVGINGGHSIEFKGAHLQVNNLAGDAYDLWFDIRQDEGVEATVRFTMEELPTADMPGRGLSYGREALARLMKA